VDDIEFRIAPNPGESARPVAKIASGGELSRIMLAIYVAAAEASERRTMIFDEVDAGIGGATADAVGRKLKALAAHHQIIVITHLPQVARFAQTHYSVEKRIADGKTQTVLTRLNEKERVAEIARMLSGGQISDTAQQHAQELIAASH
jgi:DNA repair protein RecN (Recombination protein N)